MSLRVENHLVADGRRLASRAIVLQSMQSIPCYVFRKQIIKVPNSDFDNRTDETWGGLGVSETIMEEHAFDYVPIGYAMMAVSAFMGGAIHDSNHVVSPEDVLIMGQVEPYDLALSGKQRLERIPDWTPKTSDLFCAVLDVDNYLYFELVGRSGSSMMSDFGVKYVFNQKFDLDFLDAFDEQVLDDIHPLDSRRQQINGTVPTT